MFPEESRSTSQMAPENPAPASHTSVSSPLCLLGLDYGMNSTGYEKDHNSLFLSWIPLGEASCHVMSSPCGRFTWRGNQPTAIKNQQLPRVMSVSMGAVSLDFLPS